MPTNVVMPQMGESVAEGTVVRWIKKVGDTVDRDEPLFEISTEMVDAEIPSPAAGVLLEIRALEGDTGPIDTVVACSARPARRRLPNPPPRRRIRSRTARQLPRRTHRRRPNRRSQGRLPAAATRLAPARRSATSTRCRQTRQPPYGAGRSRRRWCGGSRPSTRSTSRR